MNCIGAAETGFCTKWCTSDEQTPRPPSSTHHFRFWRTGNSFTMPLSIKYTRVQVSYGACDCSGPQAVARFGANLTSDKCTPQSVRNDTKPSAKPCRLSMGRTAVSGGSVISSRGRVQIRARQISIGMYQSKSRNSIGMSQSKSLNFIDTYQRNSLFLRISRRMRRRPPGARTTNRTPSARSEPPVGHPHTT